MVSAHQQAWAWQDEWVDLTMADIRLIELETQEYLKKRMAGDNGLTTATPSLTHNLTSDDSNQTLTNVSQVVDFNIIDKDNDNIESLQFDVPKSKKNSISQYSLAPSHLSTVSKDSSDEQTKRKSAHWSRSNSRSTLHSPGECFDVMSAWRMQSLARESESSSDEFYDAEGTVLKNGLL